MMRLHSGSPFEARGWAALRLALMYLAVWMSFGAVQLLAAVLNPMIEPRYYGQIAASMFLLEWNRGLLAAMALGFAHMLDRRQVSWPRTGWLTLAASVPAGLYAYYSMWPILNAYRLMSAPTSPYLALRYLPEHMQLFCGFAALGLIANYHRGIAESERQLADMRWQLSDARLSALQAQLNPHLLFNALNNIAELMIGQVERAQSAVQQLATLLRGSLTFASQPLVSLAEELRLIEAYVWLERLRFDDALQLHLDVGPTATDAVAPPFLIQPLVENAVKHGLAPQGGGSVWIGVDRRILLPGDPAAVDGSVELLTICVRDDGVGFQPARSVPYWAGVGLPNLQSRLANTYGQRAALQIAARAGGGVEATIMIHDPQRLNDPRIVRTPSPPRVATPLTDAVAVARPVPHQSPAAVSHGRRFRSVP